MENVEKPKMNEILLATQIAEVCHAANIVLQINTDDVVSDPWNELPPELQQSTINGVLMLFENPSTSPECLHENWKKDKEAAGYVYGKTKDDDKKTHPCLVPYGDLPKSQRDKDLLFKTICMAYIGIYAPEKLTHSGEYEDDVEYCDDENVDTECICCGEILDVHSLDIVLNDEGEECVRCPQCDSIVEIP